MTFLRPFFFIRFVQLCAVRKPIKRKSEEEIEEGLCVLCGLSGKQVQTIFVDLRVKKERAILENYFSANNFLISAPTVST